MARRRLIGMLAFALVIVTANASRFPVWVDLASDDGRVRVHADTPVEALASFNLPNLEGTRLQVDVSVADDPVPALEAIAIVTLLLDAAQAWASFEPPGSASAPGAAVRRHVAATGVRSVTPRYVAYVPFTVDETSTHGRWLLRGGAFSAGLDDVQLRTRLWRDTFLDLALLGSLNADLGASGTSAWFDAEGDARLAAWVGDALAMLDTGMGVAGEATELPTRLVGVVDLAHRAGVPAATLQQILDRTAPAGLHVRAGTAPLAAAEGSPFAALEHAMAAAGLGLDLFALTSRVSADAFDAIALQIALTEAADARLRYFEGLADRRACSEYVPDTALCDGLAQARHEFDRLRNATYGGIAASLVDARTVLDYGSIAASIGGHVAALTNHPVAAGVAAKASAGLLVIRTVASIADEGVPLRRAFLLANLNALQTMDDAPTDPRAATDMRAWVRNLEHLAMSQLVEWAYFAYLHDGYTGRFGDGTYTLHRVTQWLHGSGEVVRLLERERATALAAITGFVPLSERVDVAIGDVPVTVSIGPRAAAIAAGEAMSFSAIVNGDPSGGLTWSTDCGTIEGRGATVTYRAPTVAGTCTLAVEDSSEPGIRDAIEVVVLAEGGFTLVEDFEAYRPGTFPDPPWVADANAVSDRQHNRVVLDPTGSDGQVLHLYGSEPRNWSALAYRPCVFGDQVDLHTRMLVAGWHVDSVGRAAIQLRQGTSWRNPGRSLVSFTADGTVTVAGTEVGRFEHDRWYDVWVRYERGTDALTLSVWLDGEALGGVRVPVDDVVRERSFDHVGFDLRGALLVDALRVQCQRPAVTAAPRASLTVVVIPSLASALSLSRSDLVVTLEGPERHERVYPSVAPAYPVTVVFDDIAAGTYTVRAEHGRSRLQREIVVRGDTLQVDFVMP